MRNPFFHRQGITDADHFFGRGSLVRSLFEMIASGQCCAVLGERRIGKSSLLAYLADPRVQAAHQLDPERTLTVVLDFLALHTCSPAELWLEILEVLELETEDPKAWQILERVPRDENLSFGTFRRAMRKLKRRGFRVVLLCDEFELAIQNPQFDERFFGALRSLAGSEGVVFVTASRLSLLELGQYREEEVRQKVLGSPFFNIFAEFVVGPFRDYELAEMLSVSLDTTPIRFDRSGIDFLDRLGGRHPYFLQLSAYHLYEELRRAGLGRPTQTTALSSDELRSRLRSCQRAVREKVRRESAKIFRNQWQHSSDIEREMLATLVDEENGGSVDARIIAQLERRGLVMEAASSSPRQRRLQDTTRSSRRFRLFSELLKTWILDQVTLPSAGTVESRTSLREPLPDLPAVAEASVPERYFILEEIGRGGAGTVFKARDLRLERLVAIKVLDRQIRESPERLEPLLTEARTCAALHHPQIVTIYDIDTERGFLVQEFLPGGSLRDLLEMMPILSLKDVLSFALVHPTVGIEEPRWIETVRILPHVGISAYSVHVDHHERVFGDVVAVQLCVTDGGVGKQERNLSGVSHRFQQGSLDVRHLTSITGCGQS